MARKIQVEIIGDSASLERAFKRSGAAAETFGAKVSSSSRSIAKGAAVAGVALGTLAVAVGVKSVQAASNLGEQINKVGVVFGKSSAAIKAWATTTAASIGISNRAALEAAGTFGNMLVPMGFARNEAAGMSKRMVQLAADLASFNNASPAETLDALRAGLAGETEPLRRFGVFLSADRLAAEALGKGIVKTTKDLTKIKLATIKVDDAQLDVIKSTKKYGVGAKETQKAIAQSEYAQDQLTKAMKGTVPTLTAQQKAQATYSILLKDTADAQGDFGRTSGGLPNLMRSIRASVEDLSAAFGEGLLPVVQKVAKELQGRLADPEFRERIRALGKLIGQTLFKAFESISKWFSTNWEGIQSAFRTGADFAGKLAEAGQKVYDKFKLIASVTPGGAGTLLGVIIAGTIAVKLAGIVAQLKLINAQILIMAARLAPIAATLLIIYKFKTEGFSTGKGDAKNWKAYLPGYGWVWGESKDDPSSEKNPNRRGGRAIPRAHGGPVMPGVSYTVGERGPETLTMGKRAGYITPNGGGMSIGVVHVHGVQDVRGLLAELQKLSKHGTSQTRGRFGGQNLALT